jgi:hypothetical protein
MRKVRYFTYTNLYQPLSTHVLLPSSHPSTVLYVPTWRIPVQYQKRCQPFYPQHRRFNFHIPKGSMWHPRVRSCLCVPFYPLSSIIHPAPCLSSRALPFTQNRTFHPVLPGTSPGHPQYLPQSIASPVQRIQLSAQCSPSSHARSLLRQGEHQLHRAHPVLTSPCYCICSPCPHPSPAPNTAVPPTKHRPGPIMLCVTPSSQAQYSQVPHSGREGRRRK